MRYPNIGEVILAICIIEIIFATYHHKKWSYKYMSEGHYVKQKRAREAIK